MKSILIVVLAIVLVVGALYPAAAPQTTAVSAQGDNDILFIGGKAFPEGEVLGWIVYLMLEANGYRVISEIPYGVTDQVRQGLIDRDIDAYVEYTATGIAWLHERYPGRVPLEDAFNPTLSIATLTLVDGVENGIVWLTPAPANNTFGLAVSEAFSQENNVATVEDLAVYLNAGNDLRLAGSEEFLDRPDGLAAFETTYGFEMNDGLAVRIPQGNPQDTLPLLADGEVDVAMVYGTTGDLLIGNYVFLEDSENAQPVYQPAPTFTREAIERNPEIIDILRPVFLEIDNLALREMNAAVSIFGDTPRDAAETYLLSIGALTSPDDQIFCDVTRPDGGVNANLRSAPSTDAVRVGTLVAGSSVTADGRFTADDGVWYRLVINAWVRADVVTAAAECDVLPFVDPE